MLFEDGWITSNVIEATLKVHTVYVKLFPYTKRIKTVAATLLVWNLQKGVQN